MVSERKGNARCMQHEWLTRGLGLAAGRGRESGQRACGVRVERAERGHLGPGEKEDATRPRWLLSWARTGRGEREPGCASAGLGLRKRERGPRLNSGCWADLLGLGPVGFLFCSPLFYF